MNGIWLQSALGQELLDVEEKLLRPVMEGVFGEIFVQVGAWGEPGHFTKLARTQSTLLAGPTGAPGIAVAVEPERLPFLTDSVDVMLLPHTLDVCRQPHATLREASRVLRSDGQLIILGFKPGGVWGLRRLLAGRGYPPDLARLIAQKNLSDWLELLDLRVLERQRYFFRLPRQSERRAESDKWERLGERWWPELAACYMLRAQKRLRTLTPVRELWRRPAKVVGGLIEPSARVAARERNDPHVIYVTPSAWRRR